MVVKGASFRSYALQYGDISHESLADKPRDDALNGNALSIGTMLQICF